MHDVQRCTCDSGIRDDFLHWCERPNTQRRFGATGMHKGDRSQVSHFLEHGEHFVAAGTRDILGRQFQSEAADGMISPEKRSHAVNLLLIKVRISPFVLNGQYTRR